MNNKTNIHKIVKGALTVTSLTLLTGLIGCNQSASDQQISQAQQSEILKKEQVRGAQQKAVVEYQKRAAEQSMTLHQVNLIDSASTSSATTALIRRPIEIPVGDTNSENYLDSSQNSVKQVSREPLSTFSIDVDTGSYSNTRRFINNGRLPPSDAVREEAFINYFNYNYPSPDSIDQPFSIHSEVANAPWDQQRQIIKIGIKGFEPDKDAIKDANLVFLLDVSGSMGAADKLPLLKSSLTMLSKQLDEDDSVAIVVYAGAAGVVLPATAGNDHQAIATALDKLNAGGSTNGAQGIELAYQIAEENFKKEGVNRIILATDGDFNVGTQSLEQLKELVANKRDTGIALTTLGFGQGNYNDGLMEQLANIGNGQHAYIDTINEARKVLVDELTSSMQIIAKDVKIQVEFNPDQVAEYRLIGYQNRVLADEDFNNDKVDAGELGAGHSVTALYEISMVNAENKQIDDLRYQSNQQTNTDSSLQNNELAYVKVRYKQPDGDTSKLISQRVIAPEVGVETSQDFNFTLAVAGFAQLLKGAKYTGQWQYQDSIDLAINNKGADPFGYRSEFIQLVRTVDALQ
ncbi:VWA domain-containing protein [Psychromonas aquatilis]|uniref:VWA domain-containing protein n=1 Tax=Psychromonas aquatilis TaxID=2005072 RepID=A0ABU9GSF4_9GAMM